MINIRQVLSTDGEHLAIDYCAPDVTDGGLHLADIAAHGDIRNNAGRIELRLTIIANAETFCARCVELIESRISFDIADYFSQEHPIEDDDDANFIVNEWFEINRYVHQAIFLNIPQKFLCSADCRGLCAACGANLNKSSCKCEANPIDERFAKLQTLIDNSDS